MKNFVIATVSVVALLGVNAYAQEKPVEVKKEKPEIAKPKTKEAAPAKAKADCPTKTKAKKKAKKGLLRTDK